MFWPSPRVLSSSSVHRYDASTTLPYGDGAEQVLVWGSSFPPNRPLWGQKSQTWFLTVWKHLYLQALVAFICLLWSALEIFLVVWNLDWGHSALLNLLCNWNFSILLCLPTTLSVSSGGSSSVLMVWFSRCETRWRQLCVSCCWTDG